MTAVVWDGKTLAADRLSGSSYVKYGRATKIFRFRGSLVGLAGRASDCMALRAWFLGGCEPSKYPDECRSADGTSPKMLVVSRDSTGKTTVEVYEGGPFPMRREEPFTAIGSGEEAAVAAMIMGAGAVRAVEVASEVCTGVGGGVDWLLLEEPE